MYHNTSLKEITLKEIHAEEIFAEFISGTFPQNCKIKFLEFFLIGNNRKINSTKFVKNG